MKKFARILCLTLVAVMLCATFASCGAPAKDPADAKDALEGNDYTVVKIDSELGLAAFKIAGLDGINAIVTGTKVVEDDEGNKTVEHVSVYYFDEKGDAEAALEKVEKYSDEDNEDNNKNWVAPTQSGAMVYYGTKAAIKAAK